MNTARTTFQNPSRGTLNFDGLLDAIADYLSALPGHPAKIVIGSDSQARETTVITTVVVVQRTGRGAIYFYTRSPMKTYNSLRDRIFAEAMNSITLGQELRTRLKDRLEKDQLSDDAIEIHADVGENGITKELVGAITGMLKGYDFIPVIKPEAYAASCVADRHT